MKKLEEFWFRYFSEGTGGDERYNWVRYVWYIILCIPILVAVVLDHFKMNYMPALIVFGCLFIPFCTIWIVVWFYHKRRIKSEEKNINNSK